MVLDRKLLLGRCFLWLWEL
uniref:Uncharacterized protein n=1 Tax=Rhizophora mucronata TaxID=61149 RepID=A0A2P2QPY3_RHIMU